MTKGAQWLSDVGANAYECCYVTIRKRAKKLAKGLSTNGNLESSGCELVTKRLVRAALAMLKSELSHLGYEAIWKR
jgi:hypothetical protein